MRTRTSVTALAIFAAIGILAGSPLAAQSQTVERVITTVLSERSYTVVSTDSGANPSLDKLDVSGARTIRINFRAALCASCSPIRVEVLSNGTVIDTFNIDIHMNASRVYEVPGTVLAVRFANTTAGASNGVSMTVLGRSN